MVRLEGTQALDRQPLNSPGSPLPLIRSPQRIHTIAALDPNPVASPSSRFQLPARPHVLEPAATVLVDVFSGLPGVAPASLISLP